MVQTGSHQEAMGSSTNFRLLGQTMQSNVLLRRNLAAVSGVQAEHFKLHPDGVARAVDDCEEGQYPIENIINERMSTEGKTQYLVVYAGDWRPIDKYVWVDESGCQPADIANFKFEQRVKACEANDIANGITAENTPPTTRCDRSGLISGRITKPQTGRQIQARHRSDQTSKTSKTLAAARRAIWAHITGQSHSPEQGSDSDCEGEDISEGEQALYASRSIFRR
jgi:hypothetical protein